MCLFILIGKNIEAEILIKKPVVFFGKIWYNNIGYMYRKVRSMDYTGLKCGICEKNFNQEDDVVVCPDCGTPMHRKCCRDLSKSKGISCPNYEKHEQGYVFEDFESITKKAKAINEKKSTRYNDGDDLTFDEDVSSSKKGSADLKKYDDFDRTIEFDVYDSYETIDAKAGVLRDPTLCPLCGTKNRVSANFCDNCGARLLAKKTTFDYMNIPDDVTEMTEPKYFASYVIGQNSEVEATAVYEDDVTAGDMACYVAVNTPYYLGAFKRIKNGGKKFNFSAALFSGVWFLYRKLYRFGALMLSVQALLAALKMYFARTASLDVMGKLLQTIGLTTSEMSSITMEQYMQLSVEMQKLPVNEQLVMMMPSFILFLQIALMIICGAVANRLYYKKCLTSIKEMKTTWQEQAMSRSEISQALYLSGGVNTMLAGVFGIFYLFLLLT